MISVCIITRDESDMLRRCLETLIKYDVEIVVVDTGSKDDSRKTALEYTSKVYDFEWCDDFSAARNYAAGKAENNIILALDTDEIIESLNVQESMVEDGKAVGRIFRINQFERQGEVQKARERISRLYDRRYYKYVGRIHEQIEALENQAEEMVCDVDATVRHYGYDGSPEQIAAKAERNIRLLELDLAENGEKPYTLYQLGKSWYMCNDYEKAVEYFGKALEYDLNPKLEYVQDMVETYGYALINTGRAGEAEEILGSEEVYDAFSGWADYCFMMGLVYMNCEMHERAIDEFMKAATKNARMEGTNSYKAFYNIGVILECLGKTEEALKYYQKCGKYQAALKRINALKK